MVIASQAPGDRPLPLARQTLSATINLWPVSVDDPRAGVRDGISAARSGPVDGGAEAPTGEPDDLADELDGIDAGLAPRPEARRSGQLPPRVELGQLLDSGLAPALAAIVERAVRRRPDRANRLELEIEVKVTGPYPPTRVSFTPGRVVVEDGPAQAPSLKIEGALPDLVSLLSVPIGFAGLPNPITPRGRAVLTKVATGRVRFEGSLALRREILALLRI
jgi:hypothetical protein